MPQPAAVNEAAEELVSKYQTAWLRIMEQQRVVLRLTGRAQRNRKLRQIESNIERLLDQVDAETRRWISQRYPVIYRLGAVDGARAAGAVFDEWTDLHRTAIERLAADTFNDLLRATQFVRNDLKRFIADTAKDFSGDVLRGTPASTGSRKLEHFLTERGIKSVIYSDGSRHGLAEYAQVVIRTKTAVAYNMATLNAGRVAGILFYEVFDGPDCGWTFHADGENALGKIVTYEESVTWPISHPQCRRAFGARPDLTNPTEAINAGRSVTPAQTQDIRQNDARRRSAQQRQRRTRQRQQRRERVAR